MASTLTMPCRSSADFPLPTTPSAAGTSASGTGSEVPAALGVVGNGKSALERHGIVKVEAKQARLTQIGHARRQSYEPMVAKVTEAWRERYGDELIGELRGSLERLDAELPAGLAPHPVVRHVVGTGFREMSAAG